MNMTPIALKMQAVSYAGLAARRSARQALSPEVVVLGKARSARNRKNMDETNVNPV